MTPFLNSKPMEPQIANLISITCQLSDLKFPMTDNWVTGLIKVKLPASWETLKTVLANTEEGKLTSKEVIGQILAEEHHCICAAGGDATAYYTKSSGKGKKKKDNRKKCSHCKCKGHNISKCCTLKQEQEEKASESTPKSGTSSSGKVSNSKLSGKASSKNMSKGSSGCASTKVAADTDLDDSDKTIQVFMAYTISDQPVKHVFKTKAKLQQSNLQHG